MAQSHGIGWRIDSLPQGLSVAPRVSTCHGRWLPLEQDEGGRDRRGEGKTKRKLQCLYEQLHPFIATLSRRSSCNVTETTERQRSEHREGRTTEARLGASCPTTMEGLLPSYCPPPLPCKRAIRKTEAVIGFFLERTDQPQSLMILNIPQIFINCKEN